MDRISAERRRWNMSKIKSENTIPEMLVRKYLYGSGFRFRIHYPVIGKPDIAFPKNKIAIFINGCFWHQHGCKNSTLPKTNRLFWKQKLLKNKERDSMNYKKLKISGWKYEIIWECEVEQNYSKRMKSLYHFLDENMYLNIKIGSMSSHLELS